MARRTQATAFELLLDASCVEPAPVIALVGHDAFLQHEARQAVVGRLGGGPDASIDVLSGETAELRDVLDALGERSLFGGDRRIVVLEDADPFVKEHRPRLEQYLAAPVSDATLILEVASWPANTRLAKAVAAIGLTVRCQAPDRGREVSEFKRQMKEWLIASARRDFEATLSKGAVDELLERVPDEVGVLYQEVARLALVAGDRGRIDEELVRKHVGGWRTQRIWDLVDAAAHGRAAQALGQLDRLIAAGEEPHGLLPQMASTLRRFALVLRSVERAERRGQQPSLRDALAGAGFLPFKLAEAEQQLRQLGRARVRQLYHWLLSADLAMKGHNSGKEQARRELETLILRLSREAQLGPPARRPTIARRFGAAR